MQKILIVEDDETIFGELERLFVSSGYEVLDGREPANIPKQFDLAILDIKLPGKSGYEICAEIRAAKSCPVMFLTSMDNAESELMGFAVGGDDFVRKPFNTAVLLARVSRLLKSPPDAVEKHGLTLDVARLAACSGGKTALLSKTEFALLKILTEAVGVISQKEIIDKLWDNEAYIDENTLYVNVNRLREKLKEIGRGDAIRTVRGLGYVLE